MQAMTVTVHMTTAMQGKLTRTGTSLSAMSGEWDATVDLPEQCYPAALRPEALHPQLANFLDPQTSQIRCADPPERR